MRLRLVTWNVNSIRVRLPQVARLVAELAPDVLCLQETKCPDAAFPRAELAALGLPHLAVQGQKGWNGVALASRWPLQEVLALDLCRHGQARCVAAKVAGVEIINLYVPAGGDLPDPLSNPKFDHKLDFYRRLAAEAARWDPRTPRVVTGDLNVAPGEHDVWNHRHMTRIVTHTPVEVEALAHLQRAGRLRDVVRQGFPEPHKLFTWWSYRAADFRASNRGLRLDHVLLGPGLPGRADPHIHVDARGWEQPSDHAPVRVDLSI